jgi:hypothetical protein
LSCEHEDTAPATFRNMVGLERTAERKVSQSLRTKSWRMSPIDWNMVVVAAVVDYLYCCYVLCSCVLGLFISMLVFAGAASGNCRVQTKRFD